MKKQNTTTWWIHGSAPGGEAYFDAALAQADLSITTNAGIIEFLCHRRRNLHPNFYWLQDGKAIELFGRYANVASCLGTVVLTGSRNLQAFPCPVTDHPLSKPGHNPPRWIPGVEQHVTLSGLLCLQWVATRMKPHDNLILTGMTGYASTPKQIVRDTFDGRMGKAGGLDHTVNLIAPFTQSVIDQLPDATIYFCGKTHRIFGPPTPRNIPGNVVVCDSPHELNHGFSDAMCAAAL